MGEGNGTPVQYSCLENPMDRGAWWAAVHGAAKSRTRLSDFTFTFHFPLSCIGEGNGNPLQCSCLENPRDRGAWWAAVYGVAQSQTRLKQLSSISSNSRLLMEAGNSSWGISLLCSPLCQLRIKATFLFPPNSASIFFFFLLLWADKAKILASNSVKAFEFSCTPLTELLLE